MDSLPTETILHIIPFLPSRDLKHYSLVSTRYTPLAQQALFKAVEILEYGGRIHPAKFVDFVDDVIKKPRIGLTIKRLDIGRMFDQHRHYQPLVQLLEQVSGLRELLCHPTSFPPSITFQPHQFPLLQKIVWTLQGPGTKILHTLLPYSPVIDLSLFGWFQSKVAFDALLEPKPPKWANNLVRYTGPFYLIEGLSEDAKLLHFCSINSLSEEETLRGLASKRLLSLHVIIETYYRSLEEEHIPPSLLPSLFPNLQSVLWFTVQSSSAVRYFSKNRKLPTNGHLQSLHSFQDPANGALIACLRQLWDLRRIGFSIANLPGDGESFGRFITDLQEFVQERNLRLKCIHALVHTGGSRWSRRYTRHRNARDDLVSWEVEYGVYDTPQFVDRW
jgi:hypothetical protein